MSYTFNCTAEDIEAKLDLIELSTDTENPKYDPNSTKLQSGIAVATAVASAVANLKATSSQIALSAIKNEHLHKNFNVTYGMLKDADTYCREFTLQVSAYENIDTVFSAAYPRSSFIRVAFSPTFAQYDLTGGSEYVGIKWKDQDSISLLNLETGTVLTYAKQSGILEKTSVNAGSTTSACTEYVFIDSIDKLFKYPYKQDTFYIFRFSDTASASISVLNCGWIGCYSKYANDNKLYLYNYVNHTAKYVDFSGETPKIGTEALADNTYDATSTKPQSGKAVAEALKSIAFIDAGTFVSLSSMIEYLFEQNKAYRFYVSSHLKDIPEGQYIGSCLKIDAGDPLELHFSRILYDGINYTLNIDTGELNASASLMTDQTYTPDSSHAQSGKAVAEAIANAVSDKLAKKDIELTGSSQGDTELEEVGNSVGVVYGGATYPFWYESYSTFGRGPENQTGLGAQVVQYKTFLQGAQEGRKFRRLYAHDGVESIWTTWEDITPSQVYIDKTTGEKYSIYVDDGQICLKTVD